jgi:hypothetical protein
MKHEAEIFTKNCCFHQFRNLERKFNIVEMEFFGRVIYQNVRHDPDHKCTKFYQKDSGQKKDMGA